MIKKWLAKMIVFAGKSATRAMGVSVFRHASDTVVGVFRF